MREIFITLILFGLAILLGFGRPEPRKSRAATGRKESAGDRSTPDSQPTVDPAPAPQSVADSAMQSAAKTPPTSAKEPGSAQPVVGSTPLPELESEVTLPLATSLSLQAAIHPETLKTDAAPDLIPSTGTIVEATDESATQIASDREYPSVLEEIAQLGEADPETAIASLTQQANHSDPLIRAAAAMALGELSANNEGQAQEGIVALLNDLLHDSNSEVQLQAAASLGKMQSPVNLT